MLRRAEEEQHVYQYHFSKTRVGKKNWGKLTHRERRGINGKRERLEKGGGESKESRIIKLRLMFGRVEWGQAEQEIWKIEGRSRS